VSGSSGGRENNIAFKCTRKRLVFETHHLDAEGGVGERRTGRGEGEKAGSNWRGSGGLEVEIEEVGLAHGSRGCGRENSNREFDKKEASQVSASDCLMSSQ
jgi:hypothetical protein